MSTWFQDDRKPDWTLGLQPGGTIPLSIDGLLASDFAMIFIDVRTRQEIVGTGSFSNLTAATSSSPAAIMYSPSATDVALQRKYERHVVLKRGTSEQQTFDFGIWEVVQ